MVGPLAMDEPFYCSQQIQIPPEFPDILKDFTKAAIRTQPADLLSWSAAYFQALAAGEVPPVKQRLELPVATQKVDTGLSLGILKMLHRQLGSKKVISVDLVWDKFKSLSLPREIYDQVVLTGNFLDDVEWFKFLAISCTVLSETITDALVLCCEVLTSDEEGGPARIPYKQFVSLYEFLASIDGEIPRQTIDEALSYLSYQSGKQDGYVQPSNIRSVHCPKLYSSERSG